MAGAKKAVKKAAKRTTGKRIAAAARNVGRKIADAARAVVDQITHAVEHARAGEAPSGEASGASETIAADKGGDASDAEGEPARPRAADWLAADDLRDEAELIEAERLRQELANSRRLSADLDGPDGDLSLPRDPDGLLEPGNGASLDDELAG